MRLVCRVKPKPVVVLALLLLLASTFLLLRSGAEVSWLVRDTREGGRGGGRGMRHPRRSVEGGEIRCV